MEKIEVVSVGIKIEEDKCVCYGKLLESKSSSKYSR